MPVFLQELPSIQQWIIVFVGYLTVMYFLFLPYSAAHFTNIHICELSVIPFLYLEQSLPWSGGEKMRSDIMVIVKVGKKYVAGTWP
jgi:hypothetical protein